MRHIKAAPSICSRLNILAPDARRAAGRNWSSQGKWVHAAKFGFQKYVPHKVRQGKAETFDENLVRDVPGIREFKEIRTEAG